MLVLLKFWGKLVFLTYIPSLGSIVIVCWFFIRIFWVEKYFRLYHFCRDSPQVLPQQIEHLRQKRGEILDSIRNRKSQWLPQSGHCDCKASSFVHVCFLLMPPPIHLFPMIIIYTVMFFYKVFALVNVCFLLMTPHTLFLVLSPYVHMFVFFVM